nr:unnamed protein product [Haemonchus contortus]
MEEESDRSLRIQLLQTTAWKTQYQLLYGTRLDDLLIYPKLMIATKKLDEKLWTEMMAQPLLDIDKEPVNTDFLQVKQEIQTHFQTIEKIFRQLELLDDEVGRKEYTET